MLACLSGRVVNQFAPLYIIYKSYGYLYMNKVFTGQCPIKSGTAVVLYRFFLALSFMTVVQQSPYKYQPIRKLDFIQGTKIDCAVGQVYCLVGRV